MAVDDDLHDRAKELFPPDVYEKFCEASGEAWTRHLERLVPGFPDMIGSRIAAIQVVESDPEYLGDVMRCFAECNALANATHKQENES